MAEVRQRFASPFLERVTQCEADGARLRHDCLIAIAKNGRIRTRYNTNPSLERRTPWTARTPHDVFRFGFLVVPDFTLIGLGSAVDPLRLANHVADRPVYSYVTLSEDGGPVRSSDGIQIIPKHSIVAAPPLDAVLVIGPNPIPKRGVDPIVCWLRRLASAGIALGGVDTGSYFLARAGLLHGYRCTIHWEDMEQLLGRFPRLIVSPQLFEVDRDRCSSSGGIATVDMMIHLIGLGSGSHRLDILVVSKNGAVDITHFPYGPEQNIIRR